VRGTSHTEPLDQQVVANMFGRRAHHEGVGLTQPESRRPASTDRVFECAEAQLDVARRGRGAHQADSPCLSLEIAEASADFEAVIGQQTSAHRLVVDAFGDSDEGEGREAD